VRGKAKGKYPQHVGQHLGSVVGPALKKSVVGMTRKMRPKASKKQTTGAVKLARNRKAFITKYGATCRAWPWSWSFVNHRKKFVIFGAWDRHTKGKQALILSEAWERGETGRRKPGYEESREHLRLVEKDGYALYTYPMIFSTAKKGEIGKGTAKIDGFVPVLTLCQLRKHGANWYAADGGKPSDTPLPKDVDPKRVPAGQWREFSGTYYERDNRARMTCLHYYGYRCQGCGYKLSEIYGEVAERIIHVHHLKPVSKLPPGYRIDAINELVPLCPNCHAVVHAKKTPLSLKQLKSTIAAGRKKSRR
jgi:5-methylcytosine-specific restriction protein A